MTKSLSNMLEDLLDQVAIRKEGQELLKENDFTFQFIPIDGESFYLDIVGGKWKVAKGSTSKLFMEYRPIEGAEEVLREIFEGKVRLVDAVWEGRLRAETYGFYMYMIGWLSRIFRLSRIIRGTPIADLSAPPM
jgi:hypothetical protein